MDKGGCRTEVADGGDPPTAATPSAWTACYGEKHRWHRLTEFPAGLQPPARVRVYRRADHFILQWWSTFDKRNIAERIDGDLLAALIRARQIDERLLQRRTDGQGRRRLGHAELVERYLFDLKKRADANELSPASVRRFVTALDHYLAFCLTPAVAKNFPHAAQVNRDFRLQFAAHLADKSISSNGHANASPRPMRGQAFVLDAVRAMFEWAIDPDRGNLLPGAFHNPFRQRKESRQVFRGDPLAEPDINLAMAAQFVQACDHYQLRLFVPLILFGLRASEPCMVFREHLGADWLRVPCIEELAFSTKGKRDKRLPLIEDLRPFWDLLRAGPEQGLLYERRSVVEGRERAPLRQASLATLIGEFQARCAASKQLDSFQRAQLREELLREAGAVNYDHVEQEFHALARQLNWPSEATLKDFRHLFATMLGNTPMAESYKKYLMGHSPGKVALHAYTHLNQLHQQFNEAIRRECQGLVSAIQTRVQKLKR